ncbi:MAG: hypothetical protein ACO280_11615 [Pseudohongiellaceae bacterium]
MADVFYQAEFGATKTTVVEAGTTDANADVELRITYDATNASRNLALLALEAIKQRLIEDTWPPA